MISLLMCRHVGLLVVAASIALGSASIVAADVAPGDVPAGLKTAIQEAVEDRGHQYAGLCQEVPDDGTAIGKWCANVISVTSDEASVAFGPYATNQLESVTFVLYQGTWTPESLVPIDVPAALEAVFEAEVESRGFTYIGWCRDVPDDGSGIGANKRCGTPLSVSATAAELAYAPYATDGQHVTLKFVFQNGAWKLAAPGAPNTGTGLAGDGAWEGGPVALVLALAAVAVCAGLAATRERRS